MRRSLFLTVAFMGAVLSSPNALIADPFEGAIRQKVQDKLSNKEMHVHDDSVHRGFNHRGRETWIDGRSGQAKVLSISREGEGLGAKYVTRIEVPISSRYKRKTFIGVLREYRDEGWETQWKYTVTYTVGFGTLTLTDGKIAEASTAADHDAVQWAKLAFERDVVSKLKD